MSTVRPRTVSGMRPTGPLHLGHYFGVLKNWVELQHTEEAYFFVADWHALTSDYADPSNIATNVEEMVKDWVAAGLDPEKCVIFRQSANCARWAARAAAARPCWTSRPPCASWSPFFPSALTSGGRHEDRTAHRGCPCPAGGGRCRLGGVRGLDLPQDAPGHTGAGSLLRRGTRRQCAPCGRQAGRTRPHHRCAQVPAAGPLQKVGQPPAGRPLCPQYGLAAGTGAGYPGQRPAGAVPRHRARRPDLVADRQGAGRRRAGAL